MYDWNWESEPEPHTHTHTHTHTHVSVTSAVRNVMRSEVSWDNSDGCRWSKNTPDRSTRGGSTQIAYFSKITSTQCRNTLLHGSYNFIYHNKLNMPKIRGWFISD